MEMLKMAKVTPKDVVYDLGCGDGRIVITAAKTFGARGIGIDIDPDRIKESNENAVKAGVADRVKFIQQDIFKADLSEATVVFLYLLSELNEQLRPKLFRELKPGTRVVSHEFDMGEWKPDARGVMPSVQIYYNPGRPDTKDLDYYFWVVPADVAGLWHWSLPTPKGQREYNLQLSQKFQEIRGNVSSKGQELAVADAQLSGDKVSFTVKEEDVTGQTTVMRFDGRINRDSIKGSVEIQGGPLAGKQSWTARRRL